MSDVNQYLSKARGDFIGYLRSDLSNYVMSSDQYGLIGDNSTDSATALAAWIAAATALQGSGTRVKMVWQPGKYSIGAAGAVFTGLNNVDIDMTGVTLTPSANITQQVGSFPVALKFVSCNNCKIHGLKFDGNGFQAGAIGLQSCTDTTVFDNFSSNVGNTGIGIAQFASISGVRNIWRDNEARDANVASTAVRGFWLGGLNAGQPETDLIVRGNVAVANTATGIVLASIGAQAIGNTCLNNIGSGIISSTATNCVATKHNIVGNVCRGNAFYGYQTDVANAVLMTKVTLAGNTFDSNLSGQVLLNLCTDFTICGNSLISPSTGGGSACISVKSSTLATISGNSFTGQNASDGACIGFNTSNNTCTDIGIFDNSFNITGTVSRVITAQAVGAASVLRRISICNNTINGGETGVYVRADTAGGVIADCQVVGNTCVNFSVRGFNYQEAAAGQLTNLRVGNNSGTHAFTSTISFAFQAGNTGATPAPNCANGALQAWTQSANMTVGAPTLPPAIGGTLTLLFTSSGAFTTAWNAIFRNAPAWAVSANGQKATAVFQYDGTNWQFIGGSSAFA